MFQRGPNISRKVDRGSTFGGVLKYIVTYPSLHAHHQLVCNHACNVRLAAIEENMRRMPQMVEEYRAKCRESRRQFKEKGKSTEEEMYLKATGKIQQKHAWESSKDKKKKFGRMKKK